MSTLYYSAEQVRLFKITARRQGPNKGLSVLVRRVGGIGDERVVGGVNGRNSGKNVRGGAGESRKGSSRKRLKTRFDKLSRSRQKKNQKEKKKRIGKKVLAEQPITQGQRRRTRGSNR